ncbi:hypothetical protein M404DRAFT_27522 [Pisolithus tinctorius Marx 270]|uniref:Uncharacterized protein n=1 Tax=Pisolithus tinctorius Marx 270 TaxID=870435 RepID=A0A0C3JZX0_PISTI|nr:hypothetical protein M404DRAFT_27522 [Pisolithus tinctorius Marx 270]
MSSTCQVSLCKSNDPSSLQRATTPELQITSDEEEADIWAKMAEHKQCKAVREEAAWMEAERLEREQLEAEQCEREWVEAKKWEQEQLEAERAGEKKKVTLTRSGVPGESEASPSGVGVAAATPTDPSVAAVAKGFELITAAMDHQTMEIEEFHSDVVDLELKSLWLDQEGAGVELDEGVMHWPEDVHMKGWWSDSESMEERELQASDGEVFEGDSE